MIIEDDMSRVMRKPAFCICEYKGADQLRSKYAADQRLCFHFIDSSIPLVHKFQASSHLLWLYCPVCVRPGPKPQRQVFSQQGSCFSRIARKPALGVSNQVLHKPVCTATEDRELKFWISEVEGLYYLCSENRSTMQLICISCALVFAYAKSRFFHNIAHFSTLGIGR